MNLLILGFLANQAKAEPITLSYEQALEKAVENNPQIQIALMEQERAKMAVMSARSIFDPSLNLSAGQNRNTQEQFFAGVGAFKSEVYGPTYTIGMNSTLPTGTSLSVDWTTSRSTSTYALEAFGDAEQQISPIDTKLTMTMTQSLLQGFMIRYNEQALRQAKRALTMSEWAGIEGAQSALADTASAYWNSVYQVQIAELAQESVAIALEEERLVEARVAQGTLASVELDRVKAATLLAKVSALEAEAGLQSSLEGLLLLLGEDSQNEVHLSSKIPNFDVREMVTEKEVEQVLANNPTLQRISMDIISAEEEVRDARHALLPNLTGTARFSYTGWEDEFSDAVDEMILGDLPGRYIGLNLEVPIANWGDRGAYQQKKIALDKSHKEREQQIQTITQQVYLQLRTLEQVQTKIELHRLNILVAEKTLQTDQALRNAGRNIEKDVLASIKAVEEAKVNYERAVVDGVLAWVELQKLKGELK
jgi:outer membrane protein TolC